jgi:NAD+ synthase (glutamine-hydrolysing)
MDIANAEGGLVIGTGDLSELALGFATYNGDHMSMYCVNGSVPKTLMRVIIKYAAECAKKNGGERLAEALYDVVNTPVSPELLPLENGENKQHTESIVGPYELHDFFLYYTVKYGYAPSRIFELAESVFTEYKSEDIREYLDVFVRRFFSQQFKRSCLPDGPRVTEISLSPRGAWQMPSDVSSAIWRSQTSKGKQ